MLVVSVTLTAKPDAGAAVIALAAEVAPLSRAEPGCIRYDFLQSPHAPEQFLCFELWKSRADLDAHFQMPHFKTLAERMPALIVGEAEILTYETEGPKPAF